MKREKEQRFDRELFTFEDGGTIALDWIYSRPKEGDNKPIIAILPGLSSNNDTIYLKNEVLDSYSNGYYAVIINYRGASDVDLTVIIYFNCVRVKCYIVLQVLMMLITL